VAMSATGREFPLPESLFASSRKSSCTRELLAITQNPIHRILFALPRNQLE
jgi:hypothetical protein